MEENTVSLTWNSHVSTYKTMFNELRHKNILTDVTLACEGEHFAAHQLVLATCSEYFQSILSELHQQQRCHPIVFLRDVTAQEMRIILDYMYLGKIDLPRSLVNSLLKTAEALQIKGLGSKPEDVGDGRSLSTEDDAEGGSVAAAAGVSNLKLKRKKSQQVRMYEPSNKRNFECQLLIEAAPASKELMTNNSSNFAFDEKEPSPKRRKAVYKLQYPNTNSNGNVFPTKMPSYLPPNNSSIVPNSRQNINHINDINNIPMSTTLKKNTINPVYNFATIKSKPNSSPQVYREMSCSADAVNSSFPSSDDCTEGAKSVLRVEELNWPVLTSMTSDETSAAIQEEESDKDTIHMKELVGSNNTSLSKTNLDLFSCSPVALVMGNTFVAANSLLRKNEDTVTPRVAEATAPAPLAVAVDTFEQEAELHLEAFILAPKDQKTGGEVAMVHQPKLEHRMVVPQLDVPDFVQDVPLVSDNDLSSRTLASSAILRTVPTFAPSAASASARRPT